MSQLLDSAHLLAWRTGISPTLPLSLKIDGTDDVLVLHQLLRFLPQRRVVAEASWRGQRVLAKCFIGDGAVRYAEREVAGVQALLAASVPSPAFRGQLTLAGGGRVVMTDFLAGTQPLSTLWANLNPLVSDPAGLEKLRPALSLLHQLHERGLWHSDLHPDNFLIQAGQFFLIDGDGVKSLPSDSSEAAIDNLALLISQLPIRWQEALETLWQGYAGSDPMPADLAKRVVKIRTKRLGKYLEKTLRNCSAFAVKHNFERFLVVDRDADEWLAPLSSPTALDQGLASGEPCKNGGTCTVGKVAQAGQHVVIKRYNLKNLRHALSRCWRPSRAWHAWLAAHRLLFYGLPTPRPWLMLEKRWGFLRRSAYLVMAASPGESLLTRWSRLGANGELPALEERHEVVNLLAMLYRLRISHGDLKAHNLLWEAGRVCLIDLDAMVEHSDARRFARAWQRDRARFLRNWPDQPALTAWLDTHLPI